MNLKTIFKILILLDLSLIILGTISVLLESEILVIRAFCKYLKGLNIIITEKEFASYTGNKTIDVIEKLSSRLGIQDTDKFYNDIMTIARKIYNKDLTPVVGAEKFLNKISQQKFIASNSWKERVVQGLKKVNFYKFFGEKNIFSFDMVKKPKPEPDIYLEVIENADISPDETIIIEDSVVGVQAGVSAKIKVIGLIAGEHWFKERSSQVLIDAGAYTVVKTYEDLLKIIKEI